MVSPYIEVVVDGRRIFQHRAVMEKKLSRRLKRNEIVHHKNGNGHDNSIENLQLVTQKEHALEHIRESSKEIIRLSLSGLTNREISEKTGISTSHVWRILELRNIKAKKRSTVPVKWDLQKATEMFSAGVSLRQIGRELGVSHNAIGAKFRNMGLTTS